MNRECYLGVDGGGTKMAAVLLDSDGKERVRAVGGPCNFHSVGRAVAEKSLRDVIYQALSSAGVDIIVERLERGGRLLYFSAGTSGCLGVLDASEMPPTYSTPPELVHGFYRRRRRCAAPLRRGSRGRFGSRRTDRVRGRRQPG